MWPNKPLGVVWSEHLVELYFEYDQRLLPEMRRERCRWNPERGCWEVDPEVAGRIIRLAERLGYEEPG